MRMIRWILFAALAASPLLASAQSTTPEARFGNLREAMSEAEFKAAGLDKLDPAELAALDAWLQRRVGEQTAVAVEEVRQEAREEGRKEVQQTTRGFFDFGSEEPIVTTMAGEFRGFGKGREYTLRNGQVWEQVDDARLTGVRQTEPGVRITPSRVGNTWFLRIDGYNTSARVRRVK